MRRITLAIVAAIHLVPAPAAAEQCPWLRGWFICRDETGNMWTDRYAQEEVGGVTVYSVETVSTPIVDGQVVTEVQTIVYTTDGQTRPSTDPDLDGTMRATCEGDALVLHAIGTLMDDGTPTMTTDVIIRISAAAEAATVSYEGTLNLLDGIDRPLSFVQTCDRLADR
jgi:hypothetical protein